MAARRPARRRSGRGGRGARVHDRRRSALRSTPGDRPGAGHRPAAPPDRRARWGLRTPPAMVLGCVVRTIVRIAYRSGCSAGGERARGNEPETRARDTSPKTRRRDGRTGPTTRGTAGPPRRGRALGGARPATTVGADVRSGRGGRPVGGRRARSTRARCGGGAGPGARAPRARTRSGRGTLAVSIGRTPAEAEARAAMDAGLSEFGDLDARWPLRHAGDGTGPRGRAGWRRHHGLALRPTGRARRARCRRAADGGRDRPAGDPSAERTPVSRPRASVVGRSPPRGYWRAS